MNLKGKLAAIATTKIAEKIIPNGTIDGAINSVLNKMGKYTGQKTTDEHIESIEKNYLIIKSRSFSVGSMIGMLSGKVPATNDFDGRYRIVDSSGSIKYESNAVNTITDREILNLYSADNQKIGFVKEHLFSTGVPLLEKEVKKCSVFLEKEKICELKKYLSFGEVEFDTISGNVKISRESNKNFEIYYEDRLIATLHDVPLNLKDGYADKFVMEYDTVEDEAVATLLATAVDLINT